jgi:glutathione S-transferase
MGGTALITFYYGSGSPFAWRVWLALEYKQLAYDLRQISFSSDDLTTPEYRRINPRAKVPTIEDDGFSLYESAAIVEYLEDQYPQSGASLFPGDARNRARIRRLVNEADLYLEAAGRKLVVAVLFTNKEEWDEDQIRAGREAVAVELAKFEDYLSGDYYGGELSAADFAIYPLVALMRRMEVRKPDLDVASLIGPKMSAWIQRIESLPYYSKTYPPHWKAK